MQRTPDNGFVVGGFTTSFSKTGENLFLAKIDAERHLAWQKMYSGPRSDCLWAFRVTADGGCIIAGKTNSFNRENEESNYDVLLIKTDADGRLQWQRILWNTDTNHIHDYVNDIEIAADGGYLISGSSAGGSCAWGPIWIVKTDTAGNILWQKDFGAMSMNFWLKHPVRITADGGFMIAGEIRSLGGSDVWLIKCNATGEIEWQKSYGGARINSAFTVLPFNGDGYLFVGTSDSFQAQAGAFPDLWLFKTDLLGEIQWQKRIYTNGWDEVTSVHLTTGGGFIMAGNSTMDGGNRMFWLIKCDSLGKTEWSKRYGNLFMSNADYIIEENAPNGYLVASTKKTGA
jgi:hypothetical protein